MVFSYFTSNFFSKNFFMLKKLLKLTAFLIAFFLFATLAQASGKMEVKLDSKVTIKAENVKPASRYKWIVKKGKEIINTQTTAIFGYTFTEQGEHSVNLTVTDLDGNINNTSVRVLAGNRYSKSQATGWATGEVPLMVSLSTLPTVADDGRIHLLGNENVIFNMDATREDVIEYRIDRNIFVDTDGNGAANDDINNADTDSYLKGGVWQTQYQKGEATKIVVEITLITRDGKRASKQIEIVFDEPPPRVGDPVAILEVTPVPSPEDQLVHLYGDRAEAAFYAKRSTGKIFEYRIDQNIFFDSNGDGDPGNDIDNLEDISFKTGDAWKTEYERTDQQIIAQLIVVGEGGKGSRVQRELVFSERPAPSDIILTAEEEEGIRLEADKQFVLKGDPITFMVKGLTQSIDYYTFAWDFDNDDVIDKEIEAEAAITHIFDQPGTYAVKVRVSDTQGNFKEFILEILVKDIITTVADFDFKVEENTVRFKDNSSAAHNLADKTLTYTWSFGDADVLNFEAQKDQANVKDPVYTFTGPGTYVVTLTVVDADQVTNAKTREILVGVAAPAEPGAVIVPTEEVPEVEVEPIPEEVIPGVTPEEAPEAESMVFKLIKIFLYLILIVIVLVILIVTGFLIFLKVQHPDLTFDELVDEFKVKVLTMMGVHEMIEEEKKPEEKPGAPEAPAETPTPPPAPEVPKEEAPTSAEAPAGTPKEKAPKAPVAPPEPETHAGKEVIEGEVEEAKKAKEEPSDKDDDDKGEPPSDEEPPAGGEPPEGGEGGGEGEGEGEAPLDKQTGPVPDWLKGVQ